MVYLYDVVTCEAAKRILKREEAKLEKMRETMKLICRRNLALRSKGADLNDVALAKAFIADGLRKAAEVMGKAPKKVRGPYLKAARLATDKANKARTAADKWDAKTVAPSTVKVRVYNEKLDAQRLKVGRLQEEAQYAYAPQAIG